MGCSIFVKAPVKSYIEINNSCPRREVLVICSRAMQLSLFNVKTCRKGRVSYKRRQIKLAGYILVHTEIGKKYFQVITSTFRGITSIWGLCKK